tara:strand:- start:269 stop:460 length:192 start_codon:yes stop_codon:yes gene_type:complete
MRKRIKTNLNLLINDLAQDIFDLEYDKLNYTKKEWINNTITNELDKELDKYISPYTAKKIKTI